MEYTKRQELDILVSELELEASTFRKQWKDNSDYVKPRRARFTLSDVNKGDRRNQRIINSTATIGLRTLVAGMYSGIMSPARPWFRLTTPDPDLAEVGAVKMWLHTVTQRMNSVFLLSNLYSVTPTMFGDLALFGTAPVLIEENFTGKVINCTSFPVGSYLIAQDDEGVVNTFVRKFRMTVYQIVKKFCKRLPNGDYDLSNLTDSTKRAWEIQQKQTWVDVVHVIRPNQEYDENKAHSKYKKFSSCYYEASASKLEQDIWLRESGYDLFPVLCPRWSKTPEDVYGTDCPGTDAIGDIKALQQMERRLAEALEKMIRPPLQAPTSLQNGRGVSSMAADVTFVNNREGRRGIEPIFTVDPKVAEIKDAIRSIEDRINDVLFKPLFLMISQTVNRQVTAREIDERAEEKLTALGPVLKQVDQDFLNRLIDLAFHFMVQQSQDASGNFIEGALIPPPPDQLAGLNLKIEYISPMAQAQKLVGVSGLERTARFINEMREVFPEMRNKIDPYHMVDEYADSTGLPPRVVRTEDQVAQIEQQQAQARQQQAQAEAIQQGAGAAKNLSQADLSGNNALSKLLEQARSGHLAS